jgi:hypothetical protein
VDPEVLYDRMKVLPREEALRLLRHELARERRRVYADVITRLRDAGASVASTWVAGLMHGEIPIPSASVSRIEDR